MTVGEQLKRERKKLKVTLDDVANETKISKMFLIALENDEINRLPGGVYTRSFIRSYARFLGLDEDILTTEYHEQFSVRPQFEITYEQTKIDDLDFARQRRGNLVKLIALILLALVVYVVYRQIWGGNETSPIESPQPQIGLMQGPDVVSPAKTLPAETIPIQTSKPGDRLLGVMDKVKAVGIPEGLPLDSVQDLEVINRGAKVEIGIDDVFCIQALDRVWIEITIDGVSWTKRFLDSGDIRIYRYGNSNEIKVGDVASLAVQEGTQYRPSISTEHRFIGSLMFGPGQLIRSLETAINEPQEE